MSMINESILCNNFAGIKAKDLIFSSSVITASDMQNVELFNTGVSSGVGIRTMKGNIPIFELDGDEKIINVFKSTQRAGNYCFIHTETENEGKIYLFNSASKEIDLVVDGLIITGVSFGVDFVRGWSDLFILSTGEELLSIELEISGENILPQVIKFAPADMDGRTVKGYGLVVFDGRLWIYNESVLWYSMKGDCYDFSTSSAGLTTSSGYIEFVKNITAIAPYLGTLAVFHNDSSCLITINSDFTYSKTDESPGGCAGHYSLIFHGTQLYFYDDTKKAVFSFSQVINGDKTLSDNLAEDVQPYFSEIYDWQVNEIRMCSVIQYNKNEIWFLLPSVNDGLSDILIYDVLHSQWIHRKSQKINSMIMLDNLLHSVSDKKILKEYSGENFDGEFIPAYYTCAPLNLTVDNMMKSFYAPPRVTLDADFNNDFMVRYVKDNNYTKKYETKHIALRPLKNYFTWDVSLWDVDTMLRPPQADYIRRLPTAYFRNLEITFFTEQLSQGFSVKNMEITRIKGKTI